MKTYEAMVGNHSRTLLVIEAEDIEIAKKEKMMFRPRLEWIREIPKRDA